MAETKKGDKKPASQAREKRPHQHRSRWLYIGSLVILVIVVVTFIGAPVATSATGSQRLVFGRYNGDDIRYQPGNYFARQYQVIAQSLRDSGDGGNLELQLRLAWREAFNRTVLHTAVLQQMERSSARVSEDRIDELIAQDPRFLVNGRFDADEYRSISNQERFNLRNYHRETALFERFVGDVLEGVPAPDAEREFVASMAGPQRSFEVVLFPFSEFPDDQIAAFGKDNPQLFSQLELAVVSLAEQDEAEQIRERAVAGEPISDLARTYSRDIYADQGGEIGESWSHEIRRDLTDPTEIEELLDLMEGDTSPVLETSSGWSFYQALADPVAYHERATPEPDEELFDELRTYMEIYEQGRIQDYTRAEAESFVQRARADGFSATAEQSSREPITTGFFPINYGNVQLFESVQATEIEDLNDAAYRDDFFVETFSLAPDEVSEPIVLRNSVIVMKLLEERDAPESDRSFVLDFYGAITQRFAADEIESAYVDQEKLDDRFVESFNRYVLGSAN